MTGITGYLLTAGAGLLALLWAYMQGRISGARREQAKQTAEKLRAAEDRLEMDREASDAERKATGMSDDEARAEARRTLEALAPHDGVQQIDQVCAGRYAEARREFARDRCATDTVRGLEYQHFAPGLGEV